MKVTFKSKQKLGNKPYAKGTQMVQDHLSCNVQFKKLVKSGEIIVHARDEAQIQALHSKNSHAAKKAQAAAVAARKNLIAQSDLRELSAPKPPKAINPTKQVVKVAAKLES